ncbi:hypothetical protein LIA77_04014 [Sarocladium implicatum]|nr:hypothetical protein LIA77_04014 [Sarocladium implicatum]
MVSDDSVVWISREGGWTAKDDAKPVLGREKITLCCTVGNPSHQPAPALKSVATSCTLRTVCVYASSATAISDTVVHKSHRTSPRAVPGRKSVWRQLRHKSLPLDFREASFFGRLQQPGLKTTAPPCGMYPPLHCARRVATKFESRANPLIHGQANASFLFLFHPLFQATTLAAAARICTTSSHPFSALSLASLFPAVDTRVHEAQSGSSSQLVVSLIFHPKSINPF